MNKTEFEQNAPLPRTGTTLFNKQLTNHTSFSRHEAISVSLFFFSIKEQRTTLQVVDWTASECRTGAPCVQCCSNEIRGRAYVGVGALRGNSWRASFVLNESSPEKEILRWCPVGCQIKPEQPHCEPFGLIPLSSSKPSTSYEPTLPMACGCRWCPNPAERHTQGDQGTAQGTAAGQETLLGKVWGTYHHHAITQTKEALPQHQL